MTLLIIIFGALTLAAGVVIIINPEAIFGFLRNNLQRPVLHVLAVVVRLIIGALLILQSDVSRFALVIEIIGWLSIATALVLALMGQRRFKRLMSWALSLSRPYGRMGGVLAGAFGAFLVYAFV